MFYEDQEKGQFVIGSLMGLRLHKPSRIFEIDQCVACHLLINDIVRKSESIEMVAELKFDDLFCSYSY